MSIAEFYIENGLDPSDPNHMDQFMSYNDHDDYDDYDNNSDSHEHIVGFSGLMVGTCIVQSHSPSPSPPPPTYVLDRNSLDHLAREYNYTILDTSSSTAPMASYSRNAVRLNFWLSTGTVGSYLKHPRRGKTQLFRRNVDVNEAQVIFANPRVHTGRGYRYNSNNNNNESRKKCRYGDRCYRPDCWFSH
jgi:hypothetical protein